MFISDLTLTRPTNPDMVYDGDQELRDVKDAITSTFKNFINGALLYSPIELLGMYKFISANATDWLWVGPVQTKENKYLMAVDENYVFYARAPKSMWGTVFYTDLPPATMDSIWPNTYRLCDGGDVVNSLVNKILLMEGKVVKLPNLIDNYIRGTSSTIPAGTTLEEMGKLIPEDVGATIKPSDFYLLPYTHVHGSIRLFTVTSKIRLTGGDDSAGENDIRNTHNSAMPTQPAHTHTFPDAIISSTPAVLASSSKTTIGTPKSVIRPKTYNLYPYTRIN